MKHSDAGNVTKVPTCNQTARSQASCSQQWCSGAVTKAREHRKPLQGSVLPLLEAVSVEVLTGGKSH